MKLSADTLAQVEEIFHAITGLPPDSDYEAEALRLSNGNAALATQALSLAAAHHRREALKRPAEAVDTARVFGHYRTLHRIGSGGMGTVYLAERADGEYRHTVAIKVIHTYLSDAAFHQRFLEERQILAAMHHPAITKILDGGVTEEGTPYLVMEYIAGLPLDVYCRENHLSLRQRLQLFRCVCEPVAYAHRNLVVHRDLKPSNVIVTPEGNPILLDFGTAKFLENAPSTELTAFPLLTLRYSSPEQRQRGPLTTGTDVFSLGVILYELLTGTWPFGDASSPEALLKSFGRNAPMVSPALPTDLACILSKALAPAPEDRYESVQALSTDVENWLQGMPVTAKPKSLAYQAGKFVQRHALPLALAVGAFAALLTATGVATYQARLARDRYQQLRTLTTGLLFELKDAINDVPGSTAAQQILADRVLKNLASLSSASSDPDLQLELAEAYRQLGELQGDPYSQNLGNSKGALVTLAKGSALVEGALKRTPLSAAWLREAGFLEITAAEVSFGAGQTSDAIDHATKSAEYYERMALNTSNAAWLTDASSAYGVFGDIVGQPGTASLANPVEAASKYSRAIELDRRALALSPKLARPIRGIAIYRMKLGDLLRPTDPARALDEFRGATETLSQLPREENNRPSTKRLKAMVSRKTGNALRDLQQWRESEDALKQTRFFHNQQVTADPNDKRALYDLAVIASDQAELYFWQQDHSKMREAAAMAVSTLEDLLRKEPDNKEWQINLAFNRYLFSGERAEADKLAHLADGPGAPPLYSDLASQALLKVDPERAVLYARRFLAATKPDNVTALTRLALALQEAKQTEEATITAQSALTLLAPQKDSRIPFTRIRLQQILQSNHKLSEP